MISSLVKLLINISVVRNFVILRQKVVQNFEAKIFISLHRAHVEANERNFRCALAQIVLDVKKKGITSQREEWRSSHIIPSDPSTDTVPGCGK